jgi:hypothetical protein
LLGTWSRVEGVAHAHQALEWAHVGCPCPRRLGSYATSSSRDGGVNGADYEAFFSAADGFFQVCLPVCVCVCGGGGGGHYVCGRSGWLYPHYSLETPSTPPSPSPPPAEVLVKARVPLHRV